MNVIFLYNDIYRKSSFGISHPVLPRRISNVFDFSKLLNIKDKIQYIENQIASEKILQLFHSKDYLEVLKQTELNQFISKENSKKYNLGTFSNPIFTEMYKRHATSTGALVLAVELLNNNKYIFCPGSGAHHGKVSKASGFCYLNDIAISILVLRAKGYKKILYFDMDAHYGDGVVDYFSNTPEIFTISIHQKNLWPRTGAYLYDKLRNTLNLPVSEGFNDNQFKILMDDTIIPKMIKFKPEVALLQMGADSLKYDKMSSLELSNNSMMYSIKNIKAICEKIILMGGGGYNPWITLRAWINNLVTLIGDKDPLILNNEAKEFLKNISFIDKPKDYWLNSIKDKNNVF